MTREEIIKKYGCLIFDDDGVPHQMIHIRDIDKCIKDLSEQQPCEDAISRQEVMRIYNNNTEGNFIKGQMKKKLEELPSVTPQEPMLDKIRAEIADLDDVDYELQSSNRRITNNR